jgi:hypothetical protein
MRVPLERYLRISFRCLIIISRRLKPLTDSDSRVSIRPCKSIERVWGMIRVKSIPIFQAAKVCGFTGLILGGISSGLGLILVLIISTESPVVTLTALISLPLAGALLGFAGTAVACWVYNTQAEWSGGLRLDLEEETAAASSAGEGNAISGPSPGQDESVGAGQPTSGEPEDRRLDRERQLEQQSIRVYRMKFGSADTDSVGDGSLFHGKLGEWVDVRNEGSVSARVGGLCLYHLEHPSPGGEPEYGFVVTLPECSLRPGEILRVHSGPQRELSVLYPEDRTGADQHAFTGGEAYLWNRREGDTAILYAVATKETTDSVSFDPNLPEDDVLWREGAKLVPTPVVAGASLT